ncbi:ubinuclein-2a isoform X2 [Mastacembelus armatus]|uniref:ubinuclein-2a isoform X2 n=1 Tax=Mastacembelus armatus TaxID=205130 RepID=UPI000E4599C6|nr:ubinuclein-2-like isoform X2 [Mastacembelus armatus]
MAEPRKVQFVTLSAFAAGAAAESRKRRLEDEADFNFDRAGEVETATGAGGAASNGRLGKASDRDEAGAEKRATVRLNLPLSEPDDRSSAEFNYGELIQNLQAKSNHPGLASAHNPDDPFNDEERERLQVEALAKKFENKYGNTGKKKRKDRMQDLIDIGFGYDETDPFIDNSEAYDELVPASLTTKLGGFYINTGTLQFRAASDSEGEEEKLSDNREQVIKKRKKKDVNNAEEKNPKKSRVPKQGVTPLNLHRPEKKKRKKLMKDSLYLAAMLRRFTREKEEIKKRNPSIGKPGLAAGVANKPHSANSGNHLLASNSTHLQGNTANSDLSLADITSDPAVMSLLGSANERELQDLLGDLDFSLLDTDQQHAMATARENGILGVGVPTLKAAASGGGGQGRSQGSSSGLFPPPLLPDGLPAPLIKRIEDLRAASRQFDQEGRKKFFTLDMNNILLDIELQVQEQPPEVRSEIYSHMEAFVPCNKEALLKRLKKLSLNIQTVFLSQDDRLRTPLLKLKLAVCSVMPEQIARYNMDCMAKVAKQQSEEGEKNGSEEEDEEKPGKRVIGPRKKFIWDDKLRNLLCSLVQVKLSCYEMESQCSLSVEDYLKAFLENEVKPLWPKGWMQARILFKESLAVHSHLTGNLVKRRMVPGPKAKAKEGLWIHKAPLTVSSTPSLPTSTSVLTSSRQPPGSSLPSEPICLSDSLDEDLTAPSLDSISHALALLSNASKGLGPSDSPLSPPPLQIPTSSPPPITPHYPSASQISASAASTTQQHLVSKVDPTPLAAASAGNPPTTITTLPTSSSTSTSLSPAVSSMVRVQAAGLSLASRTADGPYGLIKGSGLVGQIQNQRLVTMASTNHRPSSVMAVTGKINPHPSPSPPKQRPPPTASPLLPPHQKGFVSPAGMLGNMGAPQGLAKSSVKASSNGSTVSSSIAPSSSPSSQSRSNSTSHPSLQSFCTPSPVASSPTPTSHAHSSQGKSHTHHHHQPNFITPMQATLTKSSHSNNSSPIIKLTPRPPAPTPPPSSSPSPASSPSHPLPHQMIPSQQQQHQYSPKTPKTFRAPFSVSGSGQVKQTQGSCSFAGGQKPQSNTSNSSINSSSNNSKGAASNVCSHPDKTPPSSSPSVSASHGQRQRVGGGVNQGSKAGNGWTASGTLATSSTTSHLSQVSTAGTPLLGSPSTLPLGFGMLGGLVPVSLPFQFPPLLNFSPPGAPGAAGMGSAPSSNSGYPLAQSDLMDLYKSLQSGSQAALPPHLQLAFSDANQSQGGDVKRKSH